MDGSPARWIALIHQLHVAGEEGVSAAMVAVFVPVVVVFWLLSDLFELVVCKKWYKTALRPSITPLLFGPHMRAPYLLVGAVLIKF
jgi:hypothetical protein